MKRLIAALGLWLALIVPAEAVPKFVWSGTAGDTGDCATQGECQGNAYTSICRQWQSETNFDPATDFVYVRESHDQDLAADCDFDGPTTMPPVRLICVEGNDTGTDPGALCDGSPSYPVERTNGGANGFQFARFFYIYGLRILSADSINLGIAPHWQKFEQSRLELITDSTSDNITLGNSSNEEHSIIFIDTDIDAVNASSNLSPFGVSAGLLWRGGTLDYSPNLLIGADDSRGINIKIENVDLTNFTGDILDSDAETSICDIELSRIKIGSGFDLDAAIESVSCEIRAYNVQVGTLSDPSLQMSGLNSQGSWDLDTTRYKTSAPGQWSDGNQEYSISADTGNGTLESFYNPLEFPLVQLYLAGDGTSHTLRFFVGAGTGSALTNAGVWVGCSSFNSAAANSLGEFTWTRAAPLATGAALTAVGSDIFTGTDEEDEYQIDIVIAPDQPGVVSCYGYVGKTNERVTFTGPEIDP